MRFGAGRPVFGARRSLGIGSDLGIGPCRVVRMVAVDRDDDSRTNLLAGIDDMTGFWPDSLQVPLPPEKGFNCIRE